MSLTLEMVSSWLQATLSSIDYHRNQATTALLGAFGEETFPFLLLEILRLQNTAPDLQQVAAVTLKNWCKSEWVRVREKSRALEFGSLLLATIQLESVSEPVLKQVSATLVAILHRELVTCVASPWEALLDTARRQLVRAWSTHDGTTVCKLLAWLQELIDTDDRAVVMSVATRCNETLAGYWLECIRSLMSRSSDPMPLSQACLMAPIFTAFVDAGAVVVDTSRWQSWLDSLSFLVSFDEMQNCGSFLVHVCRLIEAHVCCSLDNVPTAWVTHLLQRLCTIVTSSESDELASCILRILDRLVRSPTFQSLFGNETAVRQLFNNVIAPQLQLRNDELDQFDSDPLEFIKLDIDDDAHGGEGRRAGAMDLVRTLVDTWPLGLTTLLSDIATKWMHHATEAANRGDVTGATQYKTAALYLITAFCSRHHQHARSNKTGSTRRKKRTQMKSGEETKAGRILTALNTSGFLAHHVISELAHTDSRLSRAVIKAQCLRFVATFAEHIQASQRDTIVQLIQGYLLQPEQPILRAYAALAYSKVLSLGWEHAYRPVLTQLLQYMCDTEEDRNLHMFRLIVQVTQRPTEPIDNSTSAALITLIQTTRTSAGESGNPTELHAIDLLFDACCHTLTRVSMDATLWHNVLPWVVSQCESTVHWNIQDESHRVVHFASCKLIANMLQHCTQPELASQVATRIAGVVLCSDDAWTHASTDEVQSYCHLLAAVTVILGIEWTERFMVSRVANWFDLGALLFPTACVVVTYFMEHSNTATVAHTMTLIRLLSNVNLERRNTVHWKQAILSSLARISTMEEFVAVEQVVGGNAIASATWDAFVAMTATSRTASISASVFQRTIRSSLKVLRLGRLEQSSWCALIQQLEFVVSCSSMQVLLHRPLLQEVRGTLQELLHSSNAPYASWLRTALPADAMLRAVV